MKKLFKNLLSSDSWGKHFSETVRRIGKNNAGFSLVELIVVIAIMAILAAVAVIGVSVYIPKTQKAADEQMIADIQKAINLYTSGETLTPGQSGYVVVRKAGGVAVGGTMETVNNQQLISGALKATFGDNYSNELKVAYGEWNGSLNLVSSEAIKGSSYSQNPEELLGDVQTLANALSGYYGGGANAEQQANQTVLEIANASTSYIDSAALVAWWTNPSLAINVPLLAPDSTPVVKTSSIPADVISNDPEYVLKMELAVIVARVNAFVTYTGCAGCKAAYESGDEDFNSVIEPSQATTALAAVANKMNDHMNVTDGGCARCQACANTGTPESYWSNAAASNDAKAYLALMGQVNDMSDSIQDREEFSSSGLFVSDYVTNAVNGYVTIADAFSSSGANAQNGDIVIVATVTDDGSIVYQVYPMDYS